MTNNLTYSSGDLFKAPPDSILVHACNTKGSWGGGIAVAFKAKYPEQFKVYNAHCLEQENKLGAISGGSSILGTCLVIPGPVHTIACLFTSKAYGKRKDKPEEILAATVTAVKDLMKQNESGKEMHACRFNSGKFAVPWEDTEAILKELGVKMVIYDPLKT